MRLVKVAAGAMGVLAASAPLLYTPLLFGSRKTKLRVRQAEEAEDVLDKEDKEVFGVRLNGEARAYPATTGTRPHIVSDVLGGEKITVSFCGLTNSAIVYRPEAGRIPQLSVVSAPSNNVLYWEANTASLVQQIRPNVAYGPAAGRLMRTRPVVYTTWAAWRRLVPETTLADQPYGSWPDLLITRFMRRAHAKTRMQEKPAMAVAGDIDDTLHPKARIFGLYEGGEARAYTHGFLKDRRVCNDTIGGRPVSVFFEPETDIATAYRTEVDGQRLTFRRGADGGFEDAETGTRWDVLGRATAGILAGRLLEPVPFSLDKVFWFGWQRYHPSTKLLRLPGERGEPQTSRLGPREVSS